VFDVQRVRQVLFNLLSNAVKFTEQGHVEVRAAITHRNDHAQTIRIYVEDSGIGVSDEDQARLFQPFAQAGKNTHSRFGGTGLGLVISRQLLEMMGGSLTMASVPGRGTTMTLSVALPIGAPSTVPVAAPGTERASTGNPLNILVVVDNDVNLFVLEQQLKSLGHTPDLARRSQTATRNWSVSCSHWCAPDIAMRWRCCKPRCKQTTFVRWRSLRIASKGPPAPSPRGRWVPCASKSKKPQSMGLGVERSA